MDGAKAISAVATTGIKLADILKEQVLPPLIPIIAIPPTSGTGSEATHISVLTDLRKHRKEALKHTNAFPVLVSRYRVKRIH